MTPIRFFLAGGWGWPPVVDDEEFDPGEGLEQVGVTALVAGLGQGGEESGRTMVCDGDIVAAGFFAPARRRASSYRRWLAR